MTYGELNRRANQLAHYLRGLGVRADGRVGILVERSLEMIIGLLGVLKAGGAYVPLDPTYPAERLEFMVADSQPTVLLTQGDWGKVFEGRGEIRVVDLGESGKWSEERETNPERGSAGLSAEHLAYIIYTSGSTGQPKGVMVEHASVARLFSGHRRLVSV